MHIAMTAGCAGLLLATGALGLYSPALPAPMTSAVLENDFSPDTIILPGKVRDFRPISSGVPHPDFNNPALNGPYCRYVKLTLDADGKPEYSPGTGYRVSKEWRDSDNNKIAWCLYDPSKGDSAGTWGAASNGAVTSAETFAQWFRDVKDVNLATWYDLVLTKIPSGPYAGCWSFETNDFHPFLPIEHKLHGNGNDQHNWFFTYELVAEFTYQQDAGQFIRFKGDDDTWIFIDGKLVMDHGGIAGSREYFVKFDRLGLTHGQTYDMRFFHADRKQPQSQFHLWTNVPFRPVTGQAQINVSPVSD